MEKPIKLDTFMKMVMKEARRYSLVDLLKSWGITEEEYSEIESWFREMDIRL